MVTLFYYIYIYLEIIFNTVNKKLCIDSKNDNKSQTQIVKND